MAAILSTKIEGECHVWIAPAYEAELDLVGLMTRWSALLRSRNIPVAYRMPLRRKLSSTICKIWIMSAEIQAQFATERDQVLNQG